MSGFDAPFIPGWDCHGLPIELEVEKKHGKVGKTLDAKAFREVCRHYAQSQMILQRDDFIRLGVLGEWDQPYRTMDHQYEANIIRSLATIVKQGHLFQGYKPVYWCLDCASALSEAEVEYADKQSPSIDVLFKVVEPDDLFKRFAIKEKLTHQPAIPIWTTTPWSLPGNQAVAVHPKEMYVLILCDEKEILVIAKALLPTILTRYHIKHHRILGEALGEKLQGLILANPLYNKTVPVICGEHVTIDAGTGAVHIAPAHGPDDFIVAQRYQLPLDNPIDDHGCYRDDVLLFAGKHLSKINPLIIETLQSHHVLLQQETLTHSYPHCWRHKTAVIYRATPQWFISMDQNKLREHTLLAIPKVCWVPTWGENRILKMIEVRPDWCISRQRTWGVPLALFVHKQTGALHPRTIELMEKMALQIEKEGIEAWFQLDPHTVLGDDASDYQPMKDILDVWLESGLAHTCTVAQYPILQNPADLYLEGSDQHRGWFQSSLLTAIAMYQKPPYRSVLTHGFVVDGQGKKMSKSLGNVIAPHEVIQSLGADILRLWVASSDYRGEITVSQEILTRSAETYRRIRNTARFCLANLHDFDPAKHLVAHEDLLALDAWVIHAAYHLQQDILKAYDTFQFHLITQKLQHFCAVILGSFYLDIIKDRQYTLPKDSRARRSAQTALYHIVQSMVRWMAPIMSFTADEIWSYLPGKKTDSVLLETWYENLNPLSPHTAMNQTFWETVREVRDLTNKAIEEARASGRLGSALEAEVTLYADITLESLLKKLGDELRFVLITSYATLLPMTDKPTSTPLSVLAGLAIAVKPTTYPKCIRCWHRREDVGNNPTHPDLCNRCISNISGKNEARHYA